MAGFGGDRRPSARRWDQGCGPQSGSGRNHRNRRAAGTGVPDPMASVSFLARWGTARVNARTSLMVRRLSKPSSRRVASIENDHGWLVSRTRSSVTSEATPNAPATGGAGGLTVGQIGLCRLGRSGESRDRPEHADFMDFPAAMDQGEADIGSPDVGDQWRANGFGIRRGRSFVGSFLQAPRGNHRARSSGYCREGPPSSKPSAPCVPRGAFVQTLGNGVGNTVEIERIDDQRGIQFAGGPGESRQHKHAGVLRILGSDIFLGDQVHAVAQGRDQADPAAAVELDQFLAVEAAVQIVDRNPVEIGDICRSAIRLRSPVRAESSCIPALRSGRSGRSVRA